MAQFAPFIHTIPYKVLHHEQKLDKTPQESLYKLAAVNYQ
jgi:hypothetical protein